MDVTFGAGLGIKYFLAVFGLFIFLDVLGYFDLGFVLDEGEGSTYIMISLIPFSSRIAII